MRAHPLDGFVIPAVQALNKDCSNELAAINEQYPFEPLKYLPKAPRLTFEEGVALLKEAGIEAS